MKQGHRRQWQRPRRSKTHVSCAAAHSPPSDVYSQRSLDIFFSPQELADLKNIAARREQVVEALLSEILQVCCEDFRFLELEAGCREEFLYTSVPMCDLVRDEAEVAERTLIGARRDCLDTYPSRSVASRMLRKALCVGLVALISVLGLLSLFAIGTFVVAWIRILLGLFVVLAHAEPLALAAVLGVVIALVLGAVLATTLDSRNDSWSAVWLASMFGMLEGIVLVAVLHSAVLEVLELGLLVLCGAVLSLVLVSKRRRRATHPKELAVASTACDQRQPVAAG